MQTKIRLTRTGFQLGKPMLERGDPQVFGSVTIARAKVRHVWLPASIGEVIAVIVDQWKVDILPVLQGGVPGDYDE